MALAEKSDSGLSLCSYIWSDKQKLLIYESFIIYISPQTSVSNKRTEPIESANVSTNDSSGLIASIASGGALDRPTEGAIKDKVSKADNMSMEGLRTRWSRCGLTWDQGPSNHCGHSWVLHDFSVKGFCLGHSLSDTLIRVPLTTSWAQYTSLYCLPEPHRFVHELHDSMIQLKSKTVLGFKSEDWDHLNATILTMGDTYECCTHWCAVAVGGTARTGSHRPVLCFPYPYKSDETSDSLQNKQFVFVDNILLSICSVVSTITTKCHNFALNYR